MTRIRLFGAGVALLAVAIPVLTAPIARAELLQDRLRFHDAALLYGPGTTRLDGMGLRFAARDENNEINLLDFGDNPAGLLADRDSWSLDSNFSHQEEAERNPESSGFNFRSNSYSLLGAFRRPGFQALAGGIDYFETSVSQKGQPEANYTNNQYRMLYNRQFGRVGVGLEFRYRGESEKLLQPGASYLITHSTDDATGIVGLSARVTPQVLLAVRGDLRRATVSGESKTDDHQDEFDWKRPDGSARAQLFVDFPRLQGGVDVGRRKGAGEEMLKANWSPLFVFNPSIYYIRFEKQTLSEERENNHLKTRWQLEIVPGLMNVFGAYAREKTTATVTAASSVLGSRESVDESLEESAAAFGGSLTLVNDRVMLGAEYRYENHDYEDFDPLWGFTRGMTSSGVQAGTECLILPNVAVRAGLGHRSDEWTAAAPEVNTEFDPGTVGSYSATTASFGFGLIPSGGILQMDAAYQADVRSGANERQRQFTFSVRLLF